tara:strand:- start:1039 stop:1950 length:912 start_codon:yes stop_codon:yes gene_type:complete
MYDSVGLWMDSYKIGGGYIDKIPALLSNTKETIKQNGSWWISGNLENLQVYVGEAGVSIKGSPNKYWHGYNFAKLTRQEFQHSIEKISDVFSIDVKMAKASSLDIAHNFVMNEPVKSYYVFLGECSRYLRNQDRNSLYYKNNQRVKIFYDKPLEGKSKGEQLPEAWKDKNVLRFEVRFKNRLLKQFNRQSLTAEDLYDEVFYIEVIDRWFLEYLNIKKNKVMNPNIESLTSKQAKDFLLSALVDEIGQNKVVEMVGNWKGKFTTNKEAQRFKNSLQRLPGLTLESDLINELDDKVSLVKRHYR